MKLYAVFENKSNKGKVIISIIGVLLVFIGALFGYRYIRKKKNNKIEIMSQESPLTPVT